MTIGSAGLRQRGRRLRPAGGRAGRRHRRTHRHPPRVARVAVRSTSRPRPVELGPGCAHPRRRRGGRRPRRRPGGGADRRHRTGPPPRARRAQGRQAGGHRQQGAAGQRRPRALRHRRVGRRRPALRGGRRRRHPAHPPAAGVAGRRAGAADPRHRQRHHQLHPHPHGRGGGGYHEALAEAQSLGYAERDPTADVEGYDAGAKAAILATHRLRRLGVRRRRLPRGHLGAHSPPTSPSPTGWATASSCWPWPRATPTARWPCGSTRRWSPSSTPWPRWAGRSTPCSSRATRWAS